MEEREKINVHSTMYYVYIILAGHCYVKTSDVGRPMGAVSKLTALALMCGHFEITLHQWFEVMPDAQYQLRLVK